MQAQKKAGRRRIIRLREVLDKTGESAASTYRKMAEGTFSPIGGDRAERARLGRG
jgi:predicted DNA-binding transcriptional regulator AlpA